MDTLTDYKIEGTGIFFIEEREVPTTYHADPACNTTGRVGDYGSTSIVEMTLFRRPGENQVYILSPDMQHVRVSRCGVCDQSDFVRQEPPGDWTLLAECNGMDLDIFFPESARRGRVSYDRARRVCDRCDVRAQCLDWALRTRQRHGYLGGATPKARRYMEVDDE